MGDYVISAIVLWLLPENGCTKGRQQSENNGGQKTLFGPGLGLDESLLLHHQLSFLVLVSCLSSTLIMVSLLVVVLYFTFGASVGKLPRCGYSSRHQ